MTKWEKNGEWAPLNIKISLFAGWEYITQLGSQSQNIKSCCRTEQSLITKSLLSYDTVYFN